MAETVFLIIVVALGSIIASVAAGFWAGFQHAKKARLDRELAHHVLEISRQTMRLQVIARECESPQHVANDGRPIVPEPVTPDADPDSGVIDPYEFPSSGAYLGPNVQIPHSGM